MIGVQKVNGFSIYKMYEVAQYTLYRVQYHIFLYILEYVNACSQKVEDKSVTYFQIKDASDNVLELNKNSDLSPLPDDREKNEKTLKFSPNEYKDSQFWYWHQQPNSDYGYIGSKLYIKRVLSIAFSSDFENNGNFTHF